MESFEVTNVEDLLGLKSFVRKSQVKEYKPTRNGTLITIENEYFTYDLEVKEPFDYVKGRMEE